MPPPRAPDTSKRLVKAAFPGVTLRFSCRRERLYDRREFKLNRNIENLIRIHHRLFGLGKVLG